MKIQSLQALGLYVAEGQLPLRSALMFPMTQLTPLILHQETTLEPLISSA